MTWTLGQPIKQGKYRIVQTLGEGGFGITYLAQDQTGRAVVIKTLVDRILTDSQSEKFVDDFLNEALKLARCQHRHVVRVIELIREGQIDAIVMEYIEGQSLRNFLLQQTVLSEAIALHYIRQIGAALTVVHNQGLLHRDIKPDNILVRSRTDEAVLIDFGIAREFTPGSMQTHTQMLTPGYAPIEQYDERAQRGAYTDVYGLAATLYVLVTGQEPRDAQARKLEFVLHQRDSLQPPQSINPQISDRTNAAILQGLTIEPKDRPQTMQAWLNLFNSSVVITQKPAIVQQTAATLQIPNPTMISAEPASVSRQQFLKLLGLGGGGFLLAVAGKSIWDSISSNAQQLPIRRSARDLQDFSFESITVNDRGQQIQQQTKQAKFFAEDLGNGVMLEMVSIPQGTFQMGSSANENGRTQDESPQHPVTVPAFFMGRYAVTQAQYEAIVGSNPSTFKGENRPVETVTWDEAQAFCQKLSQKTGRNYRLPSEAEWEYGCRAGTTTPFYFGASITTDLANYKGIDFKSGGEIIPGNYANAPKGVDRGQTVEVGRFPPNAFGLSELHGNIWEMCEDVYHSDYQGAPIDGSAWTISDNQAANRMMRGGSWKNLPHSCRSAYRDSLATFDRKNFIGFRVACAV